MEWPGRNVGSFLGCNFFEDHATPPPFPPFPRNATENFFVENSTADSMRRFPPSWEPGNGSAASAPPRLTVWSHERGVREAASEHESEPPEICVRRVMVPFGLHTSLTPPIVWHTCTWTCEHAGLADLVGSRPHGRHRRDVGCRTRCPSCDGALRPKHRRGPADCLAHLHVDMRACRACRSRRITPSWAASRRGRLAHAVSVM